MTKKSTEKKVEEAVKAVAEEVKKSGKCDCGDSCGCKNNNHANTASGGAVYGLGFIGAVIYFIQQADSFWVGFVGFLKALVWPAILAYEALKYFKL